MQRPEVVSAYLGQAMAHEAPPQHAPPAAGVERELAHA
jgi:branched-chain amino acid transport system permease protein